VLFTKHKKSAKLFVQNKRRSFSHLIALRSGCRRLPSIFDTRTVTYGSGIAVQFYDAPACPGRRCIFPVECC